MKAPAIVAVATCICALAVGAKEFEVYGWWGIGDEYISLERYKEARAAGFTSLMQCAGVERMKKYLDWAQEAGIKIGVQHSQMLKNPEPVIEALKGHPAILWWHLKDEPHLTNYAHLAEIARRVKAVDPDPSRPVYVNMHPMGDGGAGDLRWKGTTNYVEYLERGVKEMNLPFLSLDHYPCRMAPFKGERPYVQPEHKWFVSSNWYENLEIATKIAESRNLPLSLFACCTTFSCVAYEHPTPSRATLRLEVYSALAYGAKSIQYFTYYTPEYRKPLWFRDACLERDGRRGLAYERVKRMNRELHARADNRFTDATRIATAHTDPVPNGTVKLTELPPFVKRLEAKGALVSLLRRDDEEIFMVVNRDLNRFMRLDIDIEPGVNRVLEDGEVVDAELYGKTYRLEPGYAEIFLFKRNDNN
ncbi:MAG: hypothetical protein PHG96_01785 [Kiritimatiellae bacterium]|nr:hypothetical protein [Kiritimatiellia bacterium]